MTLAEFWKPKHLRLDVIAGLTAAAVILPKALAYATVAGLPVAAGLYTAALPLIAYALLGTSRVLSVTSTATLAILTLAELGEVVPDANPARLVTAAATLSLLTGAFLLLASVAKLGFVANFISLPVLTGFKSGIGLVILLDQAPKLFGVHIEKRNFFGDVVRLAIELKKTSGPTLAVAVGTILTILVLKRLWPRSPAPLVAVAGGIFASFALDLEQAGVHVVGAIPIGLPAITLPDFSLVFALIPGALGIALMSFTESIAAARAFATPDEPTLQPNRELLATGISNLVGGLCGAMPSGGGTSQTAISRAAGATTQLASVVVALVSLGTMLFLAPMLSRMPQATLAGVVIVYSLSLLQPGEFTAIRKVRGMEFVWAIAAFLGVLAFGTLRGILISIIISLLALLRQEALTRVDVIGKKRGEDLLRPISPEHPNDETFGGLLILRPEGRLFFANAEYVADQVRTLVSLHEPKVVALDLSRVVDIEYTALQMLVEAERRTRERGVILWLVGLNPHALAGVRAIGLADQLGPERLLFNARKAIRQFHEMSQGVAAAQS